MCERERLWYVSQTRASDDAHYSQLAFLKLSTFFGLTTRILNLGQSDEGMQRRAMECHFILPLSHGCRSVSVFRGTSFIMIPNMQTILHGLDPPHSKTVSSRGYRVSSTLHFVLCRR